MKVGLFVKYFDCMLCFGVKCRVGWKKENPPPRPPPEEGGE